MPPWAEDALKLLLSQFPVVAVAAGVGSLVAWYMGRLHRDQERKLQSLYEEMPNNWRPSARSARESWRKRTQRP